MTGPLPATILISPNNQRDRIDNGSAIEFILSGGRRVRVGINADTGNLLITEASDSNIKHTIIAP